jgi:hypothetical protein
VKQQFQKTLSTKVYNKLHPQTIRTSFKGEDRSHRQQGGLSIAYHLFRFRISQQTQ